MIGQFWDAATLIAVALFIVGIVYHAGRLSSRVERLEDWRSEVRDDLKTIRTVTDSIAANFKLGAR